MVLIFLLTFAVAAAAWVLARSWNASSSASSFHAYRSTADEVTPSKPQEDEVSQHAKPSKSLVARIRAARERSIERKVEEQRRREAELEEALTGTLAPIDPGPVILQKGETAFSAISASLLELKTIRYRGRSRGVSVRIAKGVYFRQNAFRGAAQKGLVAVARGTLVATNRRLIFTGDQKSAAVPLMKISSFEPGMDGLRFSDGRRTFNFLMAQSQQQQVFATIAGRLLREATS